MALNDIPDTRLLLYAYISIGFMSFFALVILALVQGDEIPGLVYGGLIGAVWEMGRKTVDLTGLKKDKKK